MRCALCAAACTHCVRSDTTTRDVPGAIRVGAWVRVALLLHAVVGCSARCCAVLCAVAWLEVLLQRAMCNARL